MSVFKKRETVIQNIAYMGLMAAINVIFVIITTLLPVLFFLIVFVLPLTSTIVALHCKKRYYPIYAIATIGVCMLCTIWKIDDTIFYVIPSIISGFIFAVMAEKEVSAPWIIIATALVQMAFSLLSIPLIQLMFGRDIVTTFAAVFHLQDYQYLEYAAPVFIFVLSLIQSVLSFVIINEEIRKFGYQIRETRMLSFAMISGLFTSLLLVVIFALTYKPLSYTFLAISTFFGCVIVGGLFGKKKVWIYISLASSVIITLFLFAALYNYMPDPLGLLLVGIIFVLVGIIALIDKCLLNRKNKDTI